MRKFDNYYLGKLWSYQAWIINFIIRYCPMKWLKPIKRLGSYVIGAITAQNYQITKLKYLSRCFVPCFCLPFPHEILGLYGWSNITSPTRVSTYLMLIWKYSILTWGYLVWQFWKHDIEIKLTHKVHPVSHYFVRYEALSLWR